ncbi:MAG: HAD family hydrolase [Chloroflexota bacterium]
MVIANDEDRGSGAAHPLIASDLDGTLTTADTWRAVLAWIRAHHPSAAARRFVAVRVPRVIVAKLVRADRDAFRARWFADEAELLRDLPAARLTDLGGWVVETHLWPAHRPDVLARVRAEAAALASDGRPADLLLATAAYQPIADAFAARIGAVAGLGTPLAVAEGRLTGRLAAPVAAGPHKAERVRGWAGERPIAAAFGDTGSDLPLLALAARPVAVAPDAALRSAATAAGWEILDPAP